MEYALVALIAAVVGAGLGYGFRGAEHRLLLKTIGAVLLIAHTAVDALAKAIEHAEGDVKADLEALRKHLIDLINKL